MTQILAPRGGANAIAPAPVNNDVDNNVNNETVNANTCSDKDQDKGYVPGKKIPFGKAIGNFFLGLFMGSVAFIAAWLILSLDILNVHYALKSLLAAVFAFGVIKAYDKASGEVPTALNVAVAVAVIILAIITLIYGYNVNKDVKPKTGYETTIVLKSESFSFTGKERWATEVTFPSGKEYKVTVEGASVNLISSAGVLELTSKNSPYIFRTNSYGSPTFDGIEHGNGARSNVKVEWQD